MPHPAPRRPPPQEAASRAAEAEAAATKLAGELAEYKAESAGLLNQDLTIRRLEERARGLEAALEERVRGFGASLGVVSPFPVGLGAGCAVVVLLLPAAGAGCSARA